MHEEYSLVHGARLCEEVPPLGVARARRVLAAHRGQGLSYNARHVM